MKKSYGKDKSSGCGAKLPKTPLKNVVGGNKLAKTPKGKNLS